MLEKKIVIQNKHGLHARPSMMLVNVIARFKSDILISYRGLEVDAKSLMGVMMLAAKPGHTLLFKIDGEDAEEAAIEIEVLFESRFQEE